MAFNDTDWSLDTRSGRYYRVVGLDEYGRQKYEWYSPPTHARNDSVLSCDSDMAPAATARDKRGLTFQGTPERGWYERLDPSYRMRSWGEAHSFFKKGRVFAMLWAETASETMTRNGTENTAITVGRFNENVFSQIRRFVVVEVNREKHFVYACAISTYGNQGVMKRGCKASEHTIVYVQGSQPTRLTGEWEKGMTKDPIMIEPKEANEVMTIASRLRFGKIYTVEWNVKVRDIGMVCNRDKTKLISYYNEERSIGFDQDSGAEEEREQPPQYAMPQSELSPHHQQPSYGYGQSSQQSQYMTPHQQQHYAQYQSQSHQSGHQRHPYQ